MSMDNYFVCKRHPLNKSAFIPCWMSENDN